MGPAFVTEKNEKKKRKERKTFPKQARGHGPAEVDKRSESTAGGLAWLGVSAVNLGAPGAEPMEETKETGPEQVESESRVLGGGGLGSPVLSYRRCSIYTYVCVYMCIEYVYMYTVV